MLARRDSFKNSRDETSFLVFLKNFVKKQNAQKIFKKVEESGIEEFSGNEIKIWTESFPTIQNELR